MAGKIKTLAKTFGLKVAPGKIEAIQKRRAGLMKQVSSGKIGSLMSTFGIGGRTGEQVKQYEMAKQRRNLAVKARGGALGAPVPAGTTPASFKRGSQKIATATREMTAPSPAARKPARMGAVTRQPRASASEVLSGLARPLKRGTTSRKSTRRTTSRSGGR